MKTPARYAHHGPDAIRASIGFEDLLEPVARALIDFSRGLGESPVSVFAPAGADGDVHVKSAWLPGRAVFTVKVATWFRARAANGAPPGAGMVAVFDALTGDRRALLEDEHHLSDIRTAAAGGLAARAMSRPQTRTLGVLGTGVQAYLQVLAAAAVRPVDVVKVWGRDSAHVDRLVAALRRRRPDLAIDAASSAADGCSDVDLLITATASRAPLVEAQWLRDGTHITAVGADDAGKVELFPALIARADRVVVDSRALSRRFGDIAHAVAQGAISTGAAQAQAELGDVLAGRASGRGGEREITLCKLIGLGVQDLAAAEAVLSALDRTPSRPAPASIKDLRES